VATLTMLRLVENNDTKLTLTAAVDGSPVDLTTVTDVELFLKTSADQPDSDATTLTRTGGAIVDLDAAAGTAVATIPAASVTPGLTFWHADLVDSSGRHTFLRGLLTVDST